MTPSGGPSGATTTVEAEVLRVTFENDSTGFRVVRVRLDDHKELPAVGLFPQLMPGSRVRITGSFETNPRHGEQLRVASVLPLAPSTLDGVERYLASGKIPGIGQAFAKRIIQTFGKDTLASLDRGVDALRQVPGLGPRRAETIAQAWAEQRAVSNILVFLQTHGISPSLAGRIHKRFGSNAVDIVSRKPYRLALDVWGVGFATADRIARSLGIPVDAPERMQAGVYQTLVDLNERGHVFATRPALVAGASKLLDCDLEQADDAITALREQGRVRVERVPTGEDAVYTPTLHDAEITVAEQLVRLLHTPSEDARRGTPLDHVLAVAISDFEAARNLALAPAQKDAVMAAARHKVLVITGGPGVGKTTIVRALLMVLDRAKLVIRLAAPTGRAAKRMAEATGRDATTIHRLLEIDPKTRGFARTAQNPIEADALIVDEASMVDIELASSLLSALRPSTRLIFVGDVDQLPSVGPGAVLRDVIASRVVPTVRLTQIFRQAEGSLIVENAHRLQEGLPPTSAEGKTGEFYVLFRNDSETTADTIRRLVTHNIPEAFGLDPLRDVQVLTPMQKGKTGVLALNEMLQSALNPSGPSVKRGAQTFRVGDKVMQLKNDYDREVYNGDLGFIASIDEVQRKLLVTMDGREVIYAEEDLENLTLAYATTIHKSQGSEYPAVVVPLLNEHFVMLARNLLYTAVTRGKRLVVLVCHPHALRTAISDRIAEPRESALAARLVTAFERAETLAQV